MNTILVLGLALVGFAAAEPNPCCPDGAPIVNRRCPNKTRVWSAGCPNHAYAVDTSEFTISNNDTLIMDNTYVYREKYIDKLILLTYLYISMYLFISVIA